MFKDAKREVLSGGMPSNVLCNARRTASRRVVRRRVMRRMTEWGTGSNT